MLDRLGVPSTMRPARWFGKSRPILHRQPTRLRDEGRRATRIVLPRLRSPPLWQRDTLSAGADAVFLKRQDTRGSPLNFPMHGSSKRWSRRTEVSSTDFDLRIGIFRGCQEFGELTYT